MKKDLVHSLTESFEVHANRTDGGVEFWLARDLQHLLGYAEWRNFSSSVISKAKTACEVSGHEVPDHFVGVNKMVDLGSGSQREVDDIMLTRYACYLIAQNGDPWTFALARQRCTTTRTLPPTPAPRYGRLREKCDGDPHGTRKARRAE